MTQARQDLDFNAVLDSSRQKQKPLVDPSLQFDDLKQNIKLNNGVSEPKFTSEQIDDRKQNSMPLNSSAYDLNKAAHPTVCIFTFAFKVAAFIFYLLIGNFISNILTFIIVIILSAFDFWFVKNVSGRLLVGLRWVSVYDQNGKETWKFQSYDHEIKSNSVDRLFFWGSQAVFSVLWGILLVLNVLTLSLFWVLFYILYKGLLVFIAFGLCGTNLYGYYQCRGQHKKKISNMKKQYGKKVFQSFAQRIL